MSGAGDPPRAVTPLLLQVRERLDEELSLAALARGFGRSPFHFHRWFSETVGETPKRHVDRTRLERAAYLLAISDDNILEVALAVGFQNHETFTRAFRRFTGLTPRRYRQKAKAAQRARMEANRTFRGDGCRLSEVRFVAVRAQPMLAIRRLGAYATFGPDSRAALWAEIETWAQARGLACGQMRLGLFPDDPGMTPPAQQQADLCLPVQAPTEGDTRVRSLTLAGGTYAMIDHFGPYETVSQAYRNCADGIRRSATWAFREDPPAQMFVTVAEGGDPAANHSQVWFPVKRRG